MSRLDLDDLVKLMSKEGSSINTTNDWDVLCSYRTKPLNDSLAKEYSKNLIKDITVTYEEDDVTNEFKLNFGTPTISFTEESGVCQLKLPINNKSLYNCNDGKGDLPFPENYSLLVDVKLLGGIPDKQDKNKITSYVSGKGETINLDDHEEVHIIVSFDINNSRFRIDPEPSHEFKKVFRLLKAGLEEKNVTKNGEKVAQFDYSIVQIIPKRDGELVLTPKSFIFTSVKDQEGGVLNIWIQTEQSGYPQGAAHPFFKPGGTETSPIPEGHNASVIFSKELIQDKYLKPALEKKYQVETTVLDLDNKPLEGGLNLKLKLISKNKLFEKDFSYSSREGISVQTSVDIKCTRLVIDFERTPLLLSTKNKEDKNDKEDKLNLIWSWDQEFDFSLEYLQTSIGGTGRLLRTGKVKITVTVNQPTDFSTDSSKFGGTIHVNKDSVHITSTKLDDVENSFWDNLSGVIIKRNQDFPELQDKIKNTITDVIAGVYIDFQSLNYFSEANILFNGKSFSLAKESGLKIPGDCIIVGDIA